MLTNTFCHVPGLGIETEKRLWSSGLRSWELRDTPFVDTHELPMPSVPDNPFDADVDVIERIRGQYRC
jgi:hypothetical protein